MPAVSTAAAAGASESGLSALRPRPAAALGLNCGIRVRTACTAGCGPRPALRSPDCLHCRTSRWPSQTDPLRLQRGGKRRRRFQRPASESRLPALRPRPVHPSPDCRRHCGRGRPRPSDGLHCGIRVRTACTACRGPSCRSQVRTFSNAHKPDSNETRGKRRREAPPFPPS